jgi:hypothetical protein
VAVGGLLMMDEKRYRQRMQKILADCEQQMQDIIENHRDELDAFLHSDSQYNWAQAYISFALAQHFALKGSTDG